MTISSPDSLRAHDSLRADDSLSPAGLASLADIGGWPDVLGAISAGSELSDAQVGAAMSAILGGEATQAQIAGFAIGLRTKGETVRELTVALATMERFGVNVPLTTEQREKAVCTCGTGGDRSHSINISTTVAFVVAGAGAIVCKHGGRASSSASGSADVLEALGVALEITPEGVARCVEEAGVGFCLAPRFHPAMRHAGPTRKELGVATMFNFLGPLANPGRIRKQLVGVSDPKMAQKMLGVLQARGADRAIVVYGHDGLDELTTTTLSTMLELRNGDIVESIVNPAELGLDLATPDQLRGGSAAENAVFLRNVLEGAPGAHRDIVLLNASAACVVAGLANDLREGLDVATAAVDRGLAARALDALVRVSQEELAHPSA